MKILKLYKGVPREVDGVMTAMERCEVEELDVFYDHVSGDSVGNILHHGGIDRVLHHFPLENYNFLNKYDDNLNLFAGKFGENISTNFMTESNVCIGDVYRICDVEVIVTQPRKPCWVIDHVVKQKNVARKMQKLCKTGWFYRVLKEGKILKGATFSLISRDYPSLSIENCVKALLVSPNVELLKIMSVNPILSENWKNPALRVIETGELEDDSKRLVGS